MCEAVSFGGDAMSALITRPAPFQARRLSELSPEYIGTLWARLQTKFTPEPNTGCWLWTASIDEGGYGFLHVGTKREGTARMARAHRVAFELLRGAVPEGLVLDHTCRVRSCVNPQHLEPVSFADNIRRGAAPNIVAHREGRCGRCGTEFSNNGRQSYCRPCYLAYHHAYDATRRARNRPAALREVTP